MGSKQRVVLTTTVTQDESEDEKRPKGRKTVVY